MDIDSPPALRRRACPACDVSAQDARVESPHYLVCRGCGLVFRATVAAAALERWDQYYDEPRVRDYYAQRRSGFEKMVALMDQLAPERGRWLDVGCGPGGLLRAAGSHGWQACGIEPSSAAVQAQAFGEVARAKVEDGLVRFGDLRVVSFVDTLRCLERPGALLAQLRERLVNGGWVMVREVHARATRAQRRRERADAPSRSLAVAAWTPRALAAALSRAGYRNVRCLPSPVFVESAAGELRRRDGPLGRLMSIAKMGAWPLSRLIHSGTAGAFYLGPSFLALGQR
jgi:SAM-dependent methyltransferase